MTATIPEPREVALERQAPTLQQQATALVIRDAADLERAVELARSVKDLRAEAEATVRPAIDAAHKAHKAALAVLARIDDPLKAAEATLKAKIGEYQREVEAAAAREAERQRQEAQKRRDEEVEAEVEAAEAQGASAVEVAAIIEQSERIPVVAPVAYAPPKPAGMSIPRTFQAQITDPLALIRWVGEHPNYLNLVEPNQSKLNMLARAQGANLCIPGVRVVEVSNVSIRRK